ncbi:hypothetical protein ACS635_005967, partial [Pseudomonas aeruginosa]
ASAGHGAYADSNSFGLSANSPKAQCGKSLGRLGNVAPHCPACSGGSALVRAASIDIANSYIAINYQLYLTITTDYTRGKEDQ